MTKVLNEGHATMDGQYEYRNVKRWSKNVPGKDLFNLDKVFFPINQGNMHWLCACAYIQEKRIEIYDSMGSAGKKYLNAIFQYLQDDYKDKKGSPMSDVDKWKLVESRDDTPQQRNGTF
jgi:sentrin-specific protease 1